MRHDCPPNLTLVSMDIQGNRTHGMRRVETSQITFRRVK